MSFFEQLKQDIGITDMQLVGGYYIVDFCGKAVYIDGVKRLCKISEQQISIVTTTDAIVIKGQLFVDHLTEKSILISGKIISVEKNSNG